MLTIDEERYPVVIVEFEGVTTLEDTKTYLSRFDTWLARGQAFGIVVHQIMAEDVTPEQADENQIKAIHQLTAQWAKQNKPQISQHCAGIAMVVDSAAIAQERQAKTPKFIESLFGCAGQVFQSQTDAEQWVQHQLDSHT
jgi:hypothetical protein